LQARPSAVPNLDPAPSTLALRRPPAHQSLGIGVGGVPELSARSYVSPIVERLDRQPSPDLAVRRRRDRAPVEPRPLRVCMIVGYDLSEPGGVKHHAQQLAQALRLRGDQVCVVGPSSGPVDGHDVIPFKGVWRAVSNGSDNAFGLLVAPWQVWWFFQRHKFDVIHIHEPLLPSLAYWAVWATPGTPHVATFHAFGERRSGTLRAAARVGALTLYPLIQGAVAVSSSAAAYAAGTWSRPITVIPNGVSTQVFSPRPNPRADVLRLLFVGRLSDERKVSSTSSRPSAPPGNGASPSRSTSWAKIGEHRYFRSKG
jgi:hypothetical protein